MIVFDVGFVYFMFAAFCAVVIGIIIRCTRDSEYEEMIDKPFCRLMYFFIAFCTVDAVWGLLTSDTTPPTQLWYTIFSYGFHFMSALSAVAWSEYLLYYLGIGREKRLKLWALRSVIFAVQMVILLSNIWNRKFFWVDEDAVYHAYQMRNVMFYLQMSYYVIISLYCLWQRFFVQHKNGDKGEMKKYTSAVLFSFIPLISGYLQMLFPDGSMYSGGFMFAAVAIYTLNVTTQREKYFTETLRNENRKLSAIVTGLSGDYLRIYYADLVTGAYEEFANRDGNTVRIGGGEDFFIDQELLARVVVAEDEHIVRQMMTRENVIRELQDKEAFSFNYRRMVNGREKYCLAKVVRTERAAENDATGSDRIVMGVFDDDERVRTQMEYQEQLELAMKEANSASKAKSDFLFNMSHDIRTPMNAINGFTEMALRHIDDRSVVESSLEKVEMAGNHLLSIINDVLDMARIESGKMNLTEASGQIRPMCENLYEMMKGLADKNGVEFVHSCITVKDEHIFFDEGHLSQIIMNLLSNAVKYTPAGGRVVFTTEQLDDIAPGYATYRFTVCDTGIGMSEEFLVHIFDEFSREKNATQSGIQGTGLGMAIVRKLADLMNGSLNITSKQGEGTQCVFTVSFRKDAAAAEEEKQNSKKNTVELAGRRVLLVEDNELNREIACDILDDFGMLVETAEDGDIAVEKFAAAADGTFDLILMDVQMPRMNGYDAARAIRALPGGKGSKVPIIAMTANAFQQDKEDARNAGMNAHLAKPIRIEQLQETMASFL